MASRPGEGPGVRLLYNVSSSPRTRKFLQPVFIAADAFSDTLSVEDCVLLRGAIGGHVGR